MKIGTFILLVLVASVVFICFNLLVTDMETSLIDKGVVNTTSFSNSYNVNINQTTSLQEDFKPIEEGLQSLGEEGEWWEQLGDFIGAIPIIIIDFPKVVIGTLYDTIGNITLVLNEFGIPPAIIIIIGVALTIWIIFKLVNFWKSGKEI